MIKTTLRPILAIFLLFVVANSCSTKDEVISYNLVISVQPDQGGKVTPMEGSFLSDTDVKITATSNDGYLFKTWSGASIDSSDNITLRMDSDKQLTAIFEKLDGDRDGIPDELDDCSDTPEGETVDENGCSESQKDTDKDGVKDEFDKCPDTQEGETVDSEGCSQSEKDTDEDGITDNLDQCQSTPKGEAADSQGCSETQTDTDGDTVTDESDQCVDTPDGESVDENGCSESQKDTDEDGITDNLDECQSTPTGEIVDENGCSESQKDTDKDGVNDNSDECSDTPLDETVDSKGCTEGQKDTDQDGVYDNVDECANTPDGGMVDENGCSISQVDSDSDGVFDDADQCNDTPEGETVDVNGCSQSQLDQSAPVVTTITTTEITSTSFKVDWSLNEGSKGYIQFGTAPGVYIASTGIENSFLNRHLQLVGGSNLFKLNPNTTYYWQIYLEDQYGNTGFTHERSTTTLPNVSKTYVPDDVFEQNLIEQGYDDVLDDFVKTENINGIAKLFLETSFNYVVNEEGIRDFTGLQDFSALEDLSLGGGFSPSLTIPENLNLKKFKLLCGSLGFLDLSSAVSLEELRFYGDEIGASCQTEVGEIKGIANAINLKYFEFSLASTNDIQETISSAKFLETLILHRIYGFTDANGITTIDLVSNSNLKKITFNYAQGAALPNFINLKNGANYKIESIIFSGFSNPTTCVQADFPTYVQSTISIDDNLFGDPDITVSADCEN